MSHKPPVTTVPDIAIHHTRHNKTTGLKASCVASALQMAPKGIGKLMTVFKQFALKVNISVCAFPESKPMLYCLSTLNRLILHLNISVSLTQHHLSPFELHSSKKVMQVWNNMRMIKR